MGWVCCDVRECGVVIAERHSRSKRSTYAQCNVSCSRSDGTEAPSRAVPSPLRSSVADAPLVVLTKRHDV